MPKKKAIKDAPSLIDKHLEKICEAFSLHKQNPLIPITREILKAFALEIVEASLPEEHMYPPGHCPEIPCNECIAWETCRRVVFENVKKLINE